MESRPFLPVVHHPVLDPIETALRSWRTRLGHEYERVFALAVGGREGENGDECDVVTPLGKWEFFSSPKGKNSSGQAHDHGRCPGKCVCVTGPPPDWAMSAVEFLELHGIENPYERGLALCAEALRRVQWAVQPELDLGSF